jgi:hypothetical protein
MIRIALSGSPVASAASPKPGYRVLGATAEGPGSIDFHKPTPGWRKKSGAEKPFRMLLGG